MAAIMVEKEKGKMSSYEDEQTQKRLKAEREKFAKRRRDAGMPPTPGISPQYTTKEAAAAFQKKAEADFARIEPLEQDAAEIETEQVQSDTFKKFGPYLGTELSEVGLTINSPQVQEFLSEEHGSERQRHRNWLELLAWGKEQKVYDDLHAELVSLQGARKTPQMMARKQKILGKIKEIELDADPKAGSGIELASAVHIDISSND